MKLVFAFFAIALLSILSPAQDNSVENNFSKRLKKLTIEKYSMGEDATSGYDYLIYKDKAVIKKIRTIWNGGASSQPTVEDIYYEAGAPVLYTRLALTKKQFKSVVKGSTISLPAIEKFYLNDSKLVAWVENGKTVPTTDSRWIEKEKFVLEQAKETLDFYPELKSEN